MLRRFLIAIVYMACSVSLYSQNTPFTAVHLQTISEGVNKPFRIVVKNTGEIYVTDVTQKHVAKYDANYNLIKTFNVGIKPAPIAINASNEVFIGDYQTGIIYKLDANDNPVEFSNIINKGTSMVFGSDGLLYVVDAKIKQVTVLDQSGNYVRAIGQGLFIKPIAITYDNTNERLLVAEHGGIGNDVGGGMMGGGYPLTNVWVLDKEGNQLGTIGEGGSEDGQFYRIQGMSVSSLGTVFVCEPFQSYINVYENDGTYLNRFGVYGSSPGELYMPVDVVFDTQGRVLVSSMYTGAIEVYGIDQNTPTYSIIADKEVLCPGESTNIRVNFTGTAPWTFTYTKDGMDPITITDTYDDPYLIPVTEADIGIYSLTSMSDATLAANDLSGSASVTLSQVPSATISTTNTEFCLGSSVGLVVSITGVPPFSLRYSIDDVNQPVIDGIETNEYIIEASVAGSYQVNYLRGDGLCTSTSPSNAVSVIENQLPGVNLGEDQLICEGQSTTFDAGTFESYNWSNGSTAQSINASSADTYSVTVTDVNGCTSNDEAILVVNALPIADFDFVIDGNEVQFINLSENATSYLWDFGDGKTNTVIAPIHLYEFEGDYNVTLTSSNEFCSENSIKIISLISTSAADLPDSKIALIYPNPSEGIFLVKINNTAGYIKLEVLGIGGKVVYSKQYNTFDITDQIDISKFASGVYNLRIRSKEYVLIKKLILLK